MPNIKSTQEHEFNKKTVQIHEIEMLKRQNKKKMATMKKINIEEVTRKTLWTIITTIMTF